MRKWIATLLALVLTLGLATTALAEGSVKIGVIAMLTGDAPTDGLRMRQAIELVVNEVNAAGGVNGTTIELDIQDDQCTTDGAINAMNKCIADGCVFVFGPHRSSTAKAVSDIAKNAGIPYMTGGSSPSLATLENPYMFTCRASDSIMARVGGIVAVENLGGKKVGVLYCSDDFGVGAMDVASAYFQEKGVDYAVEAHNPNDADMSGQLLNLVNAGCDVLLVWTHDADMVVISRQINELGIELPVVSSGAPAMSTVSDLMEASWIEGWNVITDYCSTSEEPHVLEFKEKFRAVYDIDPEMFAASYYGAARALVDALGRAKSMSSADIRDALAETKGVQGIVGVLESDSNNAMIHQGFLVTMKDKVPQLVEVVEG